MNISNEIVDLVNNPKRVGILSTVSAKGKPNSACFGSLRFRENTVLSMGLMGGRTLANLNANSNAVLFCHESSPISFETPAIRLYLQVRSMEREGDLLERIKGEVAKNVNPEAAEMISTAVTFNVVEIRNLVDL